MKKKNSDIGLQIIVVTAMFIVGIVAIAVRKTGPERREEVAIDADQQSESPIPEPVRIPVEQEQLLTGRELMKSLRSISETQKSYALLVDKSAFTLYVYRDGRIIAQYPVELGWNPFDPKEQQGDGCTPEGLYEITWKRDIGSTEFHRALLINYPNTADRERGRTGGAIEIHGCGTGLRPTEGGENWTAGCIALSNECIDSLFMMSEGNSRIGSGTPVGIVYAGSLRDEEYELMN